MTDLTQGEEAKDRLLTRPNRTDGGRELLPANPTTAQQPAQENRPWLPKKHKAMVNAGVLEGAD